MSSVIQCQTCYCDFSCSESLSAHIEQFDSEEWLLIQELTLHRHHIANNEFDAWLLTKERALRRHENFDVESDARLLSHERALHHKSKPRESHICQRCDQSFKTLKDLDSHIGNYQLHEMHSLGKLARCRLHFRPPDISYARDNDDQCPVEGCSHKSDDLSNRKRHFEKHVECFVVCPDEKCQRSFDSASPFIHHRCTSERDVERQVLRLKKAARQRAAQEYQLVTKALRTEAHGKKNRESAPPLSDRPDKRRLLLSPSQAPIIEELSIASNIPPPDFRPNNTESFSALNHRTPAQYDNNLNGAFFLTNEGVGMIPSVNGGLDGAYYLMHDFAETNDDFYFTNEYTNMDNQNGVELPQEHSIRPSLVD
ncbi:hypothetical protein RAB80_004250 [Fusarium oxysporum f. sp. vasinfectum]|nr:hypothetical protein RAB80_004250 [Fusarium oxysporum f. sp. vasinfectum]KAK2936403.1 hypothetical protein FoTM2_004349 [Fusarium oxysporum f. sp. vasinfectum]